MSISAPKSRRGRLTLVLALMAALAAGLALWQVGLTSADAPTPDLETDLQVVRPGDFGIADIVNDDYDPLEDVDHFTDEVAACDVTWGTATPIGTHDEGLDLFADYSDADDYTSNVTNTAGSAEVFCDDVIDTQGTADGDDDVYVDSDLVHIYWLDVLNIDYNGDRLPYDIVAKPSSHRLIMTDGWLQGNGGDYSLDGFELTGVGTFVDPLGNVIDGDEAWDCGPDELDADAQDGPDGIGDELCILVHSDVEGTSIVDIQFDDNGFQITNIDTGDEGIEVRITWTHTPVELVHVQNFQTGTDGNDLLVSDADGDGIFDDGVDTAGVADHWNVIGSAHVVRTSGWDSNFVADGWQLNDQFGAISTVVAGPASCQNVLSDPDVDLWDDLSAAYQAEVADEQCIAFVSSLPGETLISFSYHDEGAEADGNEINQPDDSEINVVGPLVKEWSRLTDSVIIRVPTSWSGVDDQGIPPTDNFANNNHIDDIDWQHNNDIQGTTITADVNSTIRLIEISHGEHQTLAGPVEGPGFKADADGISHVDVDNAVVTVLVDSPRGCTFAWADRQFTGAVTAADAFGKSRTLDHGGALITITADCEEIATITIIEDYPGPVSSTFESVVQWITINWTTKEVAKQPVIRKAGEEIVLEHKWPEGTSVWDEEEDEWQCQNALGDDLTGMMVVYNKLGGPGAFVGAFNADGELQKGFPYWVNGSQAKAEIDSDCITRALYSSEDPGQVDVEAVFGGPDEVYLGIVDKHPFLVWYVKLYSVNVSLVPGDLSYRGTNNAATANDEYIVEATEGRWSPEPAVYDLSNDVRDETRVVSDYSLARVSVKDYLYLANPSGRADVCLDMDGDGGGDQDPGIPYNKTVNGDPVTTHTGCPDPDDELVAGGHWVLPDDFETLAGQQPDLMRTSWDILCGPGDTSCSGAGLIGPKRLVDTHDGTLRDWVNYNTVGPVYVVIAGEVDVNGSGNVDSADDGYVCDLKVTDGKFKATVTAVTCANGTFAVIGGKVDINGSGSVTSLDNGVLVDFSLLFYKSILPNGVVNIWDASMPLEKVTLWISGSGILLAVDKDAIYPAGNNPYYRVMIPANDLIPAQPGGFPGYDWDSTIQGPYPFWHALQWLTLGQKMQVYTDNRGQAMALVYGDANLTFDDCSVNVPGGGWECEPGDQVGQTTVSAIADYPYFRKHRDIEGNDATITWEWAGYKRVTVEPVDANHTYVVAHLLDRDGECKGKWDGISSDVRLEPVQFRLSGDGVIDEAELMDWISFDRKQASALAGTASDFGGALPFADVGSANECQAWILVQHDEEADIQVSIDFPEPEGLIRMSVEFPQQTVIWGDIDNDGDVDAVDALKVLQHVVGLPVDTDPDIGSGITLVDGADTTAAIWGDLDGDGDVDSVDAMLILQYVAGVSLTPPAGVPAIGSSVTIT